MRKLNHHAIILACLALVAGVSVGRPEVNRETQNKDDRSELGEPDGEPPPPLSVFGTVPASSHLAEEAGLDDSRDSIDNQSEHAERTSASSPVFFTSEEAAAMTMTLDQLVSCYEGKSGVDSFVEVTDDAGLTDPGGGGGPGMASSWCELFLAPGKVGWLVGPSCCHSRTVAL
jgi:hypothetical protein